MRNILNKYSVCSCHHTVTSQNFINTALIWYGPHLYSAIFYIVSYFKIVFSVLEEIRWKNAIERRETSGDEEGEKEIIKGSQVQEMMPNGHNED